MDFKLEVVTIPVSDVEAAKLFYVELLGFTLDVDYRPIEGFRVVQVSPQGSAASVQFGDGLTTANPGSARNNYLVVDDIVQAREELITRGATVSEIRHKYPLDTWSGGFLVGVEPNRVDYASVFDVSDPDGNTWLVQEIGHSR
jgi:catechol 2,3-dioxygenase-like lactoylglutathione lyase family enzyme